MLGRAPGAIPATRPQKGVVNGIELASHLGLVHKIVRQFWWATGGGLDSEDLVQAGFFGLERAAKKFDASRGHRFSTYAAWWIRHFMSRCVADQRRLVRIPVHVQTEASKRGKRIPLGHLSLDTPSPGLDPSDAPPWVETMLTNLGSADPSEQADAARSRAKLEWAMRRLDARSRDVLWSRFRRDQSLEEIGQRYGLSRERIRQIQAEALTELRRRLRRLGEGRAL